MNPANARNSFSLLDTFILAVRKPHTVCRATSAKKKLNQNPLILDICWGHNWYILATLSFIASD